MELLQQTASAKITTKLVGDILQGRLKAGERLPTERALAEEYQVSRHVVREALKRLEAMRLVTTQQGSGTYVADFATEGGLEVLEYLSHDPSTFLEGTFLEEAFVFWKILMGQTVALAAINRTDEQMKQVWVLRDRREQAMLQGDLDGVVRTGREVAALLGQATHNRFFQMVLNNMASMIFHSRSQIPLALVSPLSLSGPVLAMVDAIDQQEPELAKQYAEQVVEEMEEKIMTLYRFLHRSG